MSEYLSMGGYGAFVWSAFGFTALALGGLTLISLAADRAKNRELDALTKEERGADQAADQATRPVLRRREAARPQEGTDDASA